MKNTSLAGLIAVVIGSFLPLVRIPIIGNWGYWDMDHRLAIILWIFCGISLVGILTGKDRLVKFTGVFFIGFFIFTLFAVKAKSLDYFSFLPFKSWQDTFAGVVKLSWGWIIEFLGAFLLLISKSNKSIL